jgi:hypothetical protein
LLLQAKALAMLPPLPGRLLLLTPQQPFLQGWHWRHLAAHQQRQQQG